MVGHVAFAEGHFMIQLKSSNYAVRSSDKKSYKYKTKFLSCFVNI